MANPGTATVGVVEAVVEALLPDLVTHLTDIARDLDELIPAPPMLEAIAVALIGLLLKRGTLTITTTGEISFTAHKGAHPDDVRKD